MEQQDWSVKRLIRSIVTSRAYRLSTRYDERNKQADPQNKLVWRMSPRRLDVEALRDAMLAISGQLNTQPIEGSPAVQQLKPGWITKRVASDGYREKVEHNRRSVYLPVVRDAVPHMLETFDFARPTLVEGARPQTTVPGQALFMLNDEFVVEQSEHMARRLLDEVESGNAKRIDRAYRLALARQPSEAERRRVLEYIERAEGLAEGDDPQKRRVQAWASFCQALLGSGEFRYLISTGGDESAARADAS